MMRARKSSLLLGLMLVTCCGCSKRRDAMIIRHPEWHYQDYQRVAVLPFQAGKPAAAEAARQTEAYLVDLLSGNDAYQVSTRGDLGVVFTEQDLARLAEADASGALPEGKIQVAQALIIGTITEYDVRQEQQERRFPRYARDRRGFIIRDRLGRPIVTGFDVFIEYRHVARVGGNVRVIDSATGRVLLSRSVPALEKDDSQRGSPPSTSPETLALDLAKELATEFYRQIAPQQIKIKLDGDSLIIASEYYEGKYEELDKVPTNFERILLVARDLPKEAERNPFRLAISPKDGQDYLVEHEFTWSPNMGRRGEVVEVPLEKLLANGAQKFTAKLFAVGNERPILERDFSLAQPKGD